MKKTKYIVALVVAMFAVCAILFVACEKDEVASPYNTNDFSQNDKNVNNLILGTYDVNTSQFILDFDKEIAIEKLQRELDLLSPQRYIVEDISIYDQNPKDLNSIAALRVSVFDVFEEEVDNQFRLIEKENCGGSVRYTDKPNDNKPYVSCKGRNCDDGGCGLNDKGTGCTGCKNNDWRAHCRSKVEQGGRNGDISVGDVVEFIEFVKIVYKIISKL